MDADLLGYQILMVEMTYPPLLAERPEPAPEPEPEPEPEAEPTSAVRARRK